MATSNSNVGVHASGAMPRIRQTSTGGNMTYTLFRGVLALACVVPLASCSSAKSGAEAAVRESLKDPDSAKFGALYYNEKTRKGCLTVNARNSMGGYTGDQQAYVKRTDKGWDVVGIADIGLNTCKEVHADQPSSDSNGSNEAS
jgi:hypothetical protein